MTPVVILVASRCQNELDLRISLPIASRSTPRTDPVDGACWIECRLLGQGSESYVVLEEKSLLDLPEATLHEVVAVLRGFDSRLLGQMSRLLGELGAVALRHIGRELDAPERH